MSGFALIQARHFVLPVFADESNSSLERGYRHRDADFHLPCIHFKMHSTRQCQSEKNLRDVYEAKQSLFIGLVHSKIGIKKGKRGESYMLPILLA